MELVEPRDYGILSCINCIGIHPDESVNRKTIVARIHQPQKVVALQLMKYEEKRKEGIYNNKSCLLCGRTYDDEGRLDESWELTRERVKQEFENGGVPGLSEEQLNKIVAKCVQAWRYLWEHRASIKPEHAELMTFVGRMDYIMCHAQEAIEQGKKEIIDEKLVKQ